MGFRGDNKEIILDIEMMHRVQLLIINESKHFFIISFLYNNVINKSNHKQNTSGTNKYKHTQAKQSGAITLLLYTLSMHSLINESNINPNSLFI